MTRETRNTIITNLVIALLIMATITALFTPQIPLLRKGAEYTVQFMLFLLAFGLVALFWNKKRLVLTSFACCASLCLFLKNASNANLVLPAGNEQAKVTLAHFNMSNIEMDSVQDFFKEVESLNADILSFQEVDRRWKDTLMQNLKNSYPYKTGHDRLDLYGMWLFSKSPFNKIDTFYTRDIPYTKDIPSMDVLMNIQGEGIRIISSYICPPLDPNSEQTARSQLKHIADQVKSTVRPVIALGEYNMVYWSNDMRKFASSSGLFHSRRDVSAGSLRKPYEHIFFDDQLECTRFSEIRDANSNFLGIIGNYQLKTRDAISDEANADLSSALYKK